MRKLIFILFLLPLAVKAQNYTVGASRLRVYRSASLVLSTSWQDVDFNGSSSLNVNTFGTNVATGNLFAWYETSTKLFHVEGDYDKNMFLSFYPSTTTTVLTTPSTLQMRIVVPNGVSAGVDFYFPYPDAGGYVDIAPVTTLATQVYHPIIAIPGYANAALRTNGFKVQVKLSNALFTLGTSTLNNAAFLIQILN